MQTESAAHLAGVASYAGIPYLGYLIWDTLFGIPYLGYLIWDTYLGISYWGMLAGLALRTLSRVKGLPPNEHSSSTNDKPAAHFNVHERS